MRQNNTDELHQYWNELRGRRAAPERNDLDPSRIKQSLPDTFVLDFDSERHAVFRLAGTRLCALFGRELGGEVLQGLFTDHARDDVERLVAGVARDEMPLLAGVSVHCDAQTRLTYDLLLLPLRHRGMRAQRMLGMLTASQELPMFCPLADHLTLAGVKMLDQDMRRRSLATPSLQVGIAPGSIVARKGHLVLVDGKPARK